MKRDATVQFRGEEREVVIDDVIDEPDVNAFAIEWHFDGVSPAEHEALDVTAAEEADITHQLWTSLYDRLGGDW